MSICVKHCDNFVPHCQKLPSHIEPWYLEVHPKPPHLPNTYEPPLGLNFLICVPILVCWFPPYHQIFFFHFWTHNFNKYYSFHLWPNKTKIRNQTLILLTTYLLIIFVVVEKLLVGHKLNMCPIWLFVDRHNYPSFLTLMFSKDELIKS